MINSIGKRTASFVAIFLGTISGLASIANAQNLDIYVGGRQQPYYGDGYEAQPRTIYRQGGCSPRQALRAAIRLNVADPEVTAVGRRQIVVEGMGYHNQYVRVVFANAPGCPRIDRD